MQAIEATSDKPNATCSLWLVYHKGEPAAAYPREKMAEVYASGYSRSGDVRIVQGTFTPNNPPNHKVTP